MNKYIILTFVFLFELSTKLFFSCNLNCFRNCCCNYCCDCCFNTIHKINISSKNNSINYDQLYNYNFWK